MSLITRKWVSKMWLSPIGLIGPIGPIGPIKVLWSRCLPRLRDAERVSKMCGAGVQNVYKTENRCTEEDSIVSEMFRNTGVRNLRQGCPKWPKSLWRAENNPEFLKMTVCYFTWSMLYSSFRL